VSAQFEPLPGLMAPQIGLLWQRFKSKYPQVEQHPVLPPSVERLGLRGPMNTVRFEFAAQGSSRVWFCSERGDQLVQIQNDRFIRNWRAGANQAAVPYPRWRQHVLPQFLEDFESFRTGLADAGLGSPAINQVEVTYINHIWMNDVWRSHADLGKVTHWWAGKALPGLPVEGVNFHSVHRINSKAGEFLGRLHITLQSGFSAPEAGSADDRALFVLNIVARGRPDGDGDAGMRSFLEIGHASIVSTFESMTTDEAHNIWKKQHSAIH